MPRSRSKMIRSGTLALLGAVASFALTSFALTTMA
jgi:hypothetical protein